VQLLLQVILSCAGSQRLAASVLRLFADWLPGVCETPCANTGRWWLLRLGLYELTRPKEHADDWAWIVDHTLQLGPFKCLVIVGVRLSVWRENRRPLQHTDLALLNLTPMRQATGECVYEALSQSLPTTGVPRLILCDGAGELERGIAGLQSDHPQVARVYDVKHKLALFLKKELEQDALWGQFVADITRTRLGVTLTPLAFLVPPTLKNKARYMNLEILIKWGCSVLSYLHKPRWRPQTPVDRAQLREKLGWLTGYRRALREWSELLALAGATEDFIRRHGYHRRAPRALSARLAPLATCSAARRMRCAILEFVTDQSNRASTPTERLLGHSEVLESLIGKYKQLQSTHSKGGMTAMLLSFGSIVSRKTQDVIQAAMTKVSCRDVTQWCEQNLGVTMQAQRAFALQGNKKRIQHATRAA
jgi:hypothetical protein